MVLEGPELPLATRERLYEIREVEQAGDPVSLPHWERSFHLWYWYQYEPYLDAQFRANTPED